jgi:uroporphyrinogen-III decarboxylase
MMADNTENKKLFAEREKRVMDTVALEKTDRVPLVSISELYLVTSQGVTVKDAMYDYDKAADAFKRGLKEFDWDMSPHTYGNYPGKVMDLMGTKCFHWPGAADEQKRISDNSIYQYIEKEFLLSDEIDTFFKDPSDFTVRTLLPRLCETLEPLQHLPLPLPVLANGYFTTLVLPKMAGMLGDMGKKLAEAGAALAKWEAHQAKLTMDIMEMGYPIVDEVIADCPFDLVGDFFRGMKGTMLDMFRQPEKLLELVAYFEPHVTQMTIMGAKEKGSTRVFIPLHKGSGGFMSPNQFEKFYWPQLKRYFMALIDAGLTPMPFFEGSYTEWIDYLAELPPGKIMGHFDSMDRRKYKESLSGVMPFWGDVPPGLLVGGTIDEVKDYVKELIDFFPDGGLIVDGCAAGFPIEAKKENVMALTETVFEYGKY